MRIVIGVLAAGFVLFWGSYAILIESNLARGRHVEVELITAVKTRFPELRCAGSVGYEGPRVSLYVHGDISAQETIAICDFLSAEKAKIHSAIDVSLWINPPDCDVGDRDSGIPI